MKLRALFYTAASSKIGNWVAHPFYESYFTDSPSSISISCSLSDRDGEDPKFPEFMRMFREECLLSGAKEEEFSRFISSRFIQESAKVRKDQFDLVLVPTVPYYVGPRKWLIFIEDWITLFFPFLNNGEKPDVDPRCLEQYPMLRTMFELPNCLGILSHVESTVGMMKIIFGDIVGKKSYFIPLGRRIPQYEERDPLAPVRFLFLSSFRARNPLQTLNRGGDSALEGFARFYEENPHADSEITIMGLSNLIEPMFEQRVVKKLLKQGRIKVINSRGDIPREEVDSYLRVSDFLLVPSFRLHVVTVADGLSFGLPVLCSDGWGYDEFIVDGINGYICPGQYGVSSWKDDQGLLREDYKQGYRRNPKIVDSVKKAITRCCSMTYEERKQFQIRARNTAQVLFSIEDRNKRFDSLIERIYND